jgi:PAS domain S-box-containing protein
LDHLVHPEDIDRVQAMIDDLRKGIPYEGVLRYRGADGSTIHVQAKARLVEGANGDVGRVIGVVRDITSEVLREQELVKMRAEQEALVNGTSDLIWSVGRDFRLIAVNQAFSAVVKAISGKGVRPGDHALMPALGEPMGNAWMESYQRSLAGERFVSTMDLDLPTGDRASFQISFNPILRHGEVHGVACYAKDITLEVSARRALVESEARYRGLFRDSPVSMLVYELGNLRIRDVNDSACAHYGWARAEFMQCTVKELLLAGELPLPESDDEVDPGGNGQPYLGVMRHRRKDGSTVRMDVHAYPMSFDGRSCMMIACLDVTERERWTERLARSEADLRRAQESARIGIWKLVIPSGSLHWSDMVYSIWERPTTDRPTLDEFIDTVHPEDRIEVEMKKDLLISGIGPQEHMYRIVLPEGRIKWVYQKADVEMEKGRPVINGIVQDISGQRELEDLLQRATRLARVGSWELDLRTEEVYWSPMTREIFEVGPDFVPQLNAAIQFYKDDGSRETIRRVVDRQGTLGPYHRSCRVRAWKSSALAWKHPGHPCTEGS